MFNFLTAAIWAFVIYAIVVMLLNRRERRMMIERLGDKVTPDMLKQQLPLPWSSKPSDEPRTPEERPAGYGTLRTACLFIGVGLGLILAFLLHSYLGGSGILNKMDGLYQIQMGGISIIYIASMLLFGGLGLVVSFVIERKGK